MILDHDNTLDYLNGVQSITTHLGMWSAIVPPAGLLASTCMYLKNVEWSYIEQKYNNIGNDSGLRVVETSIWGSFYPVNVIDFYTGEGKLLHHTTIP
ncbi:MAG: hypothetical protein U5Q03_18185 [Bacteroidota bacterium]|nr:hypothetical protein [Bacteroidota bacterium]